MLDVQPVTFILERGKKSPTSERLTYWYDPLTSVLIRPDGKLLQIRPRPLTTLLSDLEIDTERTNPSRRSISLFLRAGNLVDHKPARGYFDVGDGWKREYFGYVTGIHARYVRDGFRVHVYGTGKWFNEAMDVAAIRQAYLTLQNQIIDKWQYPYFKPYTTPASTGRNLLRVSLPHGVQYERLPDETLEIIYRYCCYGGRDQPFSPTRPVLEQGVWLIDGTWEYASCLSPALPTGPCIYDSRDEIDTCYDEQKGRIVPAYPGFYHVVVTVPAGWRHIGLLKEWTKRYRPGIDTAIYPNIPGYTFDCWATGDELVLAMAYGWKIVVLERLIFPYALPDPFEAWYRKFYDLRRKACKGNSEIDTLLKAAYRNIVLHTIGSFKRSYGQANHENITVEEYNQITGRILSRRTMPGGLVSCIEQIPLPRSQQPYVRPEWAATVWGRGRASLAEFALQFPYADIVRLATDCVWAVSVPEGVPWKSAWDEPGTFVVKDHIKGPWVWPADASAMRREVERYNKEHNISDQLFDSDDEIGDD